MVRSDIPMKGRHLFFIVIYVALSKLHGIGTSSGINIPVETTTSVPRPLRVHLCSTSTSVPRPPLFHVHLCSATTSVPRPPLFRDHLCSATTSVPRPPLFRCHLDHLCSAATLHITTLNLVQTASPFTSVHRKPLPSIMAKSQFPNGSHYRGVSP